MNVTITEYVFWLRFNSCTVFRTTPFPSFLISNLKTPLTFLTCSRPTRSAISPNKESEPSSFADAAVFDESLSPPADSNSTNPPDNAFLFVSFIHTFQLVIRGH